MSAAAAKGHEEDHAADEGGAPAGRPHVGGHPRQQTPGGDVVDGGAGDRHHADARPGEPALLQDAREHGERGDAESQAQEQREGERRDLGSESRPDVPATAKPRPSGTTMLTGLVTERGAAGRAQHAQVEVQARPGT